MKRGNWTVSGFVLYYGAQLSCSNVGQLLGSQKTKDAAKNSLFDRYSRKETLIWPTYWQRDFEVDISLGLYADHYIFVAIIRSADKSLARLGRKQATATEDFDFHISYL